MVNKKNQKQLEQLNKKLNRDLFKLTPNPCDTAVPGTQEQVFCQVQKYPRIVVLPKGYGYLEVLQLNPCVEVGTVDSSCGFNCCTQPPFAMEGNRIVINSEKASQPYNPNPPFPPVPREEQIKCYNLASALNQCDINKRNFFPNSGRPESLRSGPFGAI